MLQKVDRKSFGLDRMPNLILWMPSSNRPKRTSDAPSATCACALLGSRTSARRSSSTPRSCSPMSAKAQPANPRTSEAFRSMTIARSASSRAPFLAASDIRDQRQVGSESIEQCQKCACQREVRVDDKCLIHSGSGPLPDGLLIPALHGDCACSLTKMRPRIDALDPPLV